MRLSFIFSGAFVGAVVCMPTGDVVHEKRNKLPSYFLKQFVTADTAVPVRIALKQRNLEKAMELLMNVSDPDSKNYGKHYTRDQVAELFGPSQNSVDIVKKWLIQVGILSEQIVVTKNKSWLRFNTTVGQLETMLQTKYHIYKDQKTQTNHLGTDIYTLPLSISDHVDFIAPGVTMLRKQNTTSRLLRQRVKSLPHTDSASGCDNLITPACIKDMYNITDGTMSDSSNRLGIYQDNNELDKQSDLDQFYSLYAKGIPKGFGPKLDLIDWGSGAPNSSYYHSGEAALDLQVSIPIIYPQSTEVYQSHDNGVDYTGFFNQWLDGIDGSYCTYEGGDDPVIDGPTPDEMCGTFTPAHVISISYGLTEHTWSTKYLERQCNEFMKLGLQGSSIVFASGDGGVAGSQGDECLGDGSVFSPTSPASCQYVTAVGATYLETGKKPGDPESATTGFSSGGGFSNIWITPDYQKDAVSNFFSQHLPSFPGYNTSGGIIPASGGVYNRAGRGFPDVAAAGDNGAVVLDGKNISMYGTSMSAPIFAAILTRINEERIKVGKKLVGFVNPALYKNPAMFHDITIGDQLIGGGKCKDKAFSTTPGWDPVTGLGTPNYPAMLSYFLSLP